MKTNNDTSPLCPCGCGRSCGSGRNRKIVCAAFWRGLPEWLRSNFTSPASDTGTRRAAAREIIERARAHRQNNEQLRLKL